MKGIQRKVKSALYGIKGWRHSHPIVVIESDDWGMIRIPEKNSLEGLDDKFSKYYNSPYYKYDTQASASDLLCLFEVLSSVKDLNQNPAILTANTVVNNPDFDKIKNSDYHQFYTEPFSKSLIKHRGQEALDSWFKGMSEKVFHPQLHANVHVDHSRWLKYLQEGDEVYLDAFERGIYAVDRELNQFKKNLTAALDNSSEQDEMDKIDLLIQGCREFESVFGYKSESFIAPSYTWSSNVEKALWNEGVKYFQGIKVQKVPTKETGRYNMPLRYLGEQNELGQRYLVRNAFFEPSLTPDFNLDEVKNRIKWLMRLKLPVILGTHRINFTGSLVPSNQERNINMFGELLQFIAQKWPNVVFMTSDQLGKQMDQR